MLLLMQLLLFILVRVGAATTIDAVGAPSSGRNDPFCIGNAPSSSFSSSPTTAGADTTAAASLALEGLQPGGDDALELLGSLVGF